MNTSTRFKTGSIPVEEALRALTDGLGQADGARAAAYERLGQMRNAKASLLIRQSDLLAQKLGENHPRVVALKSQAVASRQMSRDLQVAAIQTATPAPDVKPEGYAVHGFVRTSKRDPVAQAVVALYDDTGKLRRDFEHATTDKLGYFVLVTDRLLPVIDVTGKENEPAPSVALELRVFDANQKPLAEAVSLEARAGQLDFEEILISDEPLTDYEPPDSTKPGGKTPGTKPTRDPRAVLKTISTEIAQDAAGGYLGGQAGDGSDAETGRDAEDRGGKARGLWKGGSRAKTGASEGDHP